ncbi:hypothetical protein KSP40_PGU007259 [Platanthera guangdongensis]|uniref:Uncharacterized protein n=1 Tax=Platanthera guangdongensis TaxID=2320717 RepID=A0ABR2LUF6_9ASPA
MKVAMQDVAKKLVLWHTPTFRPIITHDDLEPIMASLGFVSDATTTAADDLQWKEYSLRAFSSDLQQPLLLRLPFPRIDGLHLVSYKAFLCALEHYISSTEVYNLFHVRTHGGESVADVWRWSYGFDLRWRAVAAFGELSTVLSGCR